MMRRWMVVVLAALLAFAGAPAAKAGPYTAEYVFGDSLTDTGNLLALAAANPGAFTGVVLPLPPYFTGRYSNGPVWVERLATSLGLPLAPSLAGGTNYSYAGALTGSGRVPSVQAQAGTYLAAAGGVADPGALYVVSGGGNDIRAATTADPAIAQAASDNLAAVLASLYAAGARNFLVATPPDVSLLPEVQGPGPVLAAIRDLRLALGTLLRAELLADIAAFLAASPGAMVAGLDIFGLVQDAVADPARYGLTNVTDACLTVTAGIPSVCATPDTYLFWDGIHPTATGHAILGAEALAALVAVPEPATLALLAVGLIGIVTISSRAPGAGRAKAGAGHP